MGQLSLSFAVLEDSVFGGLCQLSVSWSLCISVSCFLGACLHLSLSPLVSVSPLCRDLFSLSLSPLCLCPWVSLGLPLSLFAYIPEVL